MNLNLGYMDALKQTIDDVDGEAYLRTLYGATVVDEVALGVGVLALPSDIADIMQDARVRAVKAHAGIYSVTSEVDPVTGGMEFNGFPEGSAPVNFKRPEDGAVASTVGEILKERILLSNFGGKVNGVADDTTAWRKAIKAAYNAGYAMVITAPGVSIISGDIFSLVPADSSARIEIVSEGSGYYGGTVLKASGANFTMAKVRSAGVVFRGLIFSGDGATYGNGATVTAIEAIGAQQGTEWNLDMQVFDCGFVFAKAGIVQSGKNLVVGGATIFSNSLNGITCTKNSGATETRGLQVGSQCRFHSIGGQSVPACAIILDAASDFLDVQIKTTYFDDCYEMVRGFAAPLQISGGLASRNWGGIHLDTTGRTITEIGKNHLQISDLILHFLTTSTVQDGLSLYSHIDLCGTITGIEVFNPSGHGVFIDSAANKALQIKVNNISVREPGDGGAYDCIKLGKEVGGVQIDNVSLERGASTTTGVGLRTVGTRTAAQNLDLANIFGNDIRVTGFAVGNRVSIANPKDIGPERLVKNDWTIQTVTLDQDFSLTVGTNGRSIRLTTSITANRNITVSNTNAYDGARFRIWHDSASANSWNIYFQGVGSPATSLAAGQYCEVVYHAPVAGWVLQEKSPLIQP